MIERSTPAFLDSAAIQPGNVQKLLGMAFGFACCCPLLLLSGVNMRLTDAACGVAGLLGVWTYLRTGQLHPGAARLAPVLLLSIGWIAVEIYFTSLMESQAASHMVLFRWFLAIPGAYWLSVCSGIPILRGVTLWGMIGGWFVDTILLTYDYFAYERTGVPAFTSDYSRVSWIDESYRAIGIFDHPNAAAIASLFLVPLLIGRAEETGRHKGLFGVAGWIVTILVFYLTRSRGAMFGAVGLLLYWMLRRLGPMAKLATLLAVLGVAMLFLLWPGALHGPTQESDISEMLNRFTDTEAIRENSGGRLDTVLASLQLVLTHPFGMGSTYAPMLDNITGEFEATHNGLLQLALLGGLPLGLLALAMLMRAVRRLWRGPAMSEEWVAVYFLCVTMFEEVFFIPTASIVMLWLIARLGWPLFNPCPASAWPVPPKVLRP